MIRRKVVKRTILLLSGVCIVNAILLIYSISNDEVANTEDTGLIFGNLPEFLNLREPFMLAQRVSDEPKRVHVSEDNTNAPYVNDKAVLSRKGQGNSTLFEQCSGLGSGHFLLVAVLSECGNVAHRDIIRQTWAKSDILPDDAQRFSARVVFFVHNCYPADDRLQNKSAINEEADCKGDTIIIQNRFTHSVTVALLSWVNSKCSGATFFLAVDDESMVLFDNLVVYLKNNSRGDLYVTSYRNVKINATVEEQTRNTLTTRGLYKINHLLLSRSTIQKLVNNHSPLPTDDNITLNNTATNNDYNITYHYDIQVKFPAIKFCKLSRLITCSDISPNDMGLLWNRYQKYGSTFCKFVKSNGTYLARPHEENVNKQINRRVDYVINSPYLCFRRNGSPFVLVLVMSDTSAFAQRGSIRQSWGSVNEVDGYNFNILFVTKVPETFNEFSQLSSEFNKHGDVLHLTQDNESIDGTLRLITALQWANTYCPTVSYILVTRADTFIHTKNVINLLKSAPKTNFVIGLLINNTKPERQSKLPGYISKSDWSSDYFPPYPDASAYIMSADVATLLIHQFSQRKTFGIAANVFLGILLHDGNIVAKSTHEFLGSNDGGKVCTLNKLLSMSLMSAQVMYRAWKGITEWTEYVKCGTKVGTFLSDISHSSLKQLSHQGLDSVNQRDKHKFKFIINHPDACESNQQSDNKANTSTRPLGLLIGVMTSAKNRAQRNVIRKTWGDPKYTERINNSKITTLFFVGIPKSPSLQRKLEQENDEYGDIIQANFLDTYRNLTSKTVSLMKWATIHCHGYDYVIKADDDVFINWSNMVTLLTSAPRESFYFGDSRIGSIPQRDPMNKWYTPKEVWPYATYPPYNSGQVYVVSVDVARLTYLATLTISLYPWEDVFMGAVLSRLDISPFPHVAFDNTNGLMRTPCGISLCASSHHFDHGSLWALWNATISCQRNPTSCPCSKNDEMFGRRYSVQKLKPQPPNFAALSLDYFNISSESIKIMQNADHDLIINNPSICLNGNDVDILIIIITSPAYYDKRRLIRSTWANYDVINGRHIEFLFFMGKASDGMIQHFVKNEFRIHKDIIQDSFEDYKTREVHKAVYALRWASVFCQRAKVVTVMHADIFMNIPNLVTFLETREDFTHDKAVTYMPCFSDNCECGKTVKRPSALARMMFDVFYVITQSALRRINRELANSFNIEKLLHNAAIDIRSSSLFNPTINILDKSRTQDDVNICDLHDVIISRSFIQGDIYVIAQRFYESENNYFQCPNRYGMTKFDLCGD